MIQIIELLHEDLKSYSDKDIQLMVKYTNLKTTSVEDLRWLLAINLAGNIQSGMMPPMENNRICKSRFIYIKELGEGTFGEVYEVFDTELGNKLALKVSHFTLDEGIEQEIGVIRKLTAYKIPNVVQYFGDGYCSLLNNKRYYTMDIQDEQLHQFIKNKNHLTQKNLFTIFFELVYTLMKFRQVQFKHRDISELNVLYRVTTEPREYKLLSGQTVSFTTLIQPVISDFNTSIFEKVDPDDPNEVNDVRAILELVIKLIDITDWEDDKDYEKLEYIIHMFEDDDLSPEFAGQILEELAPLVV
uniref:Protein kinase n=1 Tax=Marseillevirus LCMAC202 TaxID=2506606 RepID=A0A481YXT8_9VIRU|nr:MAG: protein kinase [Marseillevirus LCMAC202]